MKLKKTLLLFSVGTAVCLLSAGWSYGQDSTSCYEQHPPQATQFWVQLLPSVLDDGSNMRIVIQYTDTRALPSVLNIYTDMTTVTSIYDDGTHGDDVAGDGIYSGYVTEDIPSFLTTVQTTQGLLNSQPALLQFNGHLGTSYPGLSSGGPGVTFDYASFNANLTVAFSSWLLSGPSCSSYILKQNSLFITDIGVVEDPARTYNTYGGAGNPTGIYTFGNLITQIANTSHTLIDPKELMKSIVKNWTVNLTLNGQTVAERQDVFYFLISQWLHKAQGLGAPTYTDIGNDTMPNATDPSRENWEYTWDNLNPAQTAALMQNAPFKLTTIANRIDLRGNSSYTGTVSNSGETRFIYTLENLYDMGGFGDIYNHPGQPPVQSNQGFGVFPDFMDWEGMNIIFEFGNVQTNACDLQAFAQQWLNLSGLTLGSPAFNTALEAITSTVINAGAGSAQHKVNGSAIDRVRTNERVFQHVFPSNNAGWSASDWEFRQFELSSADGMFHQVTLTNTPVNSANNMTLEGSNYESIVVPSPSDQTNLIDWAFSTPGITNSVHNGTQSLPETYTYLGVTSPLKSAAARVDAEFSHYWDLNWVNSTTHYTSPYSTMTGMPADPYYKQMRNQLSLNTCQGCHAGETKTIFTQVKPLAYGATARYWDPIPDHVVRSIDFRFASNAGTTNDAFIGPTSNNATASGDFVKVSAFLTGENYTGYPYGTFADDNNDPSESPADNTMDGLFYVYSPDNDYYGWSPGTNVQPFTQMYGYNDLERRKLDLCGLINAPCSPEAIRIFEMVSLMPFPIASH